MGGGMNLSARLLEFLVAVLLVPPQAGVRVELILYRQEGLAWLAETAGGCVTDAGGRCEIHGQAEVWKDGLMRGMLDAQGYGQRPVIWRGGDIKVEIPMNETLHVDGRYDYLSSDESAAPALRSEPRGGLISLFAAVLFLALTLAIHRKARRL